MALRRNETFRRLFLGLYFLAHPRIRSLPRIEAATPERLGLSAVG